MDAIVAVISMIVAVLVILAVSFFINSHGILPPPKPVTIVTATILPIYPIGQSSTTTVSRSSVSSVATTSSATTAPTTTASKSSTTAASSGTTIASGPQTTQSTISTITSTSTATSTVHITLSSTTIASTCSTGTVTLYVGNTLACGSSFAVTLTNTTLVFGAIEYANLNVFYDGSVAGSVSVEANSTQKFTTNDTTLTVHAYGVYTGSSASQNWAQISLSST